MEGVQPGCPWQYDNGIPTEETNGKPVNDKVDAEQGAKESQKAQRDGGLKIIHSYRLKMKGRVAPGPFLPQIPISPLPAY